jgi:hypothetical protein
MAGTVTAARERRYMGDCKKVEVVVVTWLSDASGDATLSLPLNGWLVKAVTNPGATAPTDNYDITLVDENSIDAAEGLLANRDTANTETVYPLVTGAACPVLLSGTHTFTVAAAGNAKEGVCTLYIVESM